MKVQTKYHNYHGVGVDGWTGTRFIVLGKGKDCKGYLQCVGKGLEAGHSQEMSGIHNVCEGRTKQFAVWGSFHTISLLSPSLYL